MAVKTVKSQAIVVPLCGYTPPAELEQFVVGFSTWKLCKMRGATVGEIYCDLFC